MQPIINMLEEDQTTDMGNMHKKIDKDRVRGSGDILADRQTNILNFYSSQCFASAPTGEVVTTCAA